MKKRILIFSLAYEPLIGGAEIAIKELAERLAPNSSFDMVTLRFSHKHPRREQIGAVSVHRVSGGKFLFPFAAAFRALSLHRRNRYDAVWAIMANRAGAAALLFKIFHPRTPLILTLQEGDPISDIMRSVGILRPLFKLLFRRANVVTAISAYLAEWAKKMGVKNVVLVPNGVDIEKFKRQNAKAKNEDKIIITTSRLVPKNGVGDLIAAMRYLPTHYKLLIVGSGPLDNSLKLLTARYSLQTRVSFAGEIAHNKLPSYLWGSDIFIRPSLSEGFGISFIEAMAAGLPVIATPVGGIPDFLKDKETGIFCKVNNPKSIADAVLLLENQPALREAIIAGALRMAVERYDWNIVTAQMREVFDRLYLI